MKHYQLDKLEIEVNEALKKEGELPLSKLWKRFSCHLWEINPVLRKLKQKGLIEEELKTE